MFLFIGEISLQQPRHSYKPKENCVPNADWVATSTEKIIIHHCDFSPAGNRCLANAEFTIGLSGDPVIEQTKGDIPKTLAMISAQLRQNRDDLLESANGVFCGFNLEKTTKRVHLITDYLGFRQIYIHQSSERIVFANAQWLIEDALPPHSPFDEQAIIEIGVLGHPLGNRTRRRDVIALGPGSILTINADGTTVTRQFADLTSVKPQQISDKDALDALHTTWNRAVQARLHETSDPFAFLSGGMDSRLLVHTLKSFGAHPRTANFAPPNTMDRVFAEQAANSIGVPIWFHPTGDLNIDFVTETVTAWSKMEGEKSDNFANRKIWSGDGGSVGMGHVYLDDDMIQLAANGKFDLCASRFCEFNKRRPVARAYRLSNVEERFEDWIGQLMKQYAHTQPERAPYYFLMLNDQRRHLDKHYETFHIRNFDFELPFFDRKLIELVASLPARQFNLHRMYDALFKKIGGTIAGTPWQTYPGHVPCELPAPTTKLEYQWGENFYSDMEKSRKRRRAAWQSLVFCSRPSSGQGIFNKSFIAASSIFTLAGITDRSYLYQCIAPALGKKAS